MQLVLHPKQNFPYGGIFCLLTDTLKRTERAGNVMWGFKYKIIYFKASSKGI
jgi:hypothetical protein